MKKVIGVAAHVTAITMGIVFLRVSDHTAVRWLELIVDPNSSLAPVKKTAFLCVFWMVAFAFLMTLITVLYMFFDSLSKVFENDQVTGSFLSPDGEKIYFKKFSTTVHEIYFSHDGTPATIVVSPSRCYIEWDGKNHWSETNVNPKVLTKGGKIKSSHLETIFRILWQNEFDGKSHFRKNKKA